MPSDATLVDLAVSTCTRHLQAVGDLGFYALCLVAVRPLQLALLLLRCWHTVKNLVQETCVKFWCKSLVQDVEAIHCVRSRMTFSQSLMSVGVSKLNYTVWYKQCSFATGILSAASAASSGERLWVLVAALVAASAFFHTVPVSKFQLQICRTSWAIVRRQKALLRN